MVKLCFHRWPIIYFNSFYLPPQKKTTQGLCHAKLAIDFPFCSISIIEGPVLVTLGINCFRAMVQ